MVQITRSARFKKAWKKLPKNIREKAENVILMLVSGELSPAQHDHQLHGVYQHYRSINVTPDWRIVYRKETDTLHLFAIGTHAQLYA
jgi:addiction module RelE/StbE family toxin